MQIYLQNAQPLPATLKQLIEKPISKQKTIRKTPIYCPHPHFPWSNLHMFWVKLYPKEDLVREEKKAQKTFLIYVPSGFAVRYW